MSDVSGFTAGGRGHIENFLIGLGVEGDDWQERRGTLKHIVSGKVLGGGTDRDFGFVDLDANRAPISQRIKVNTSLNK